MKLIIKYFWTVVIVPGLLFLKGDLDLSSFLSNNVKPITEFSHVIKVVVAPTRLINLEIKIKAVSKNCNFSAEGMLVQLFDNNYTLIVNSQVIHGKVRFELPVQYMKIQKFKVVSPSTADEITINNLYDEHTLAIHEAQLTELSNH